MSAEPGPVDGLAFGNEDNVYQQVLASFPLCDVTEDDLSQNPQFFKLLTSLAHHVDKTGLTAPLKVELERTQLELLSQRRVWLQSESFYRALQEMIQDHKVRKHHSTMPPDENMFYETVEKCLLVAQCARQLDPSSTTKKDQLSILGLTPQDIMKLLPSEKNVQKIKQNLPGAVENHLKDKCLSFVSYYQPKWENQSEHLKSSKFSHLSAQLEKDKKKVERLKESSREKRVLLQRQTQLYLSEMIKCVQLIQSFILENRLKIQADLDGKKLEYLENKCELVWQKIKGDMVAIQLETYTADTIFTHQKIRKILESELSTCQAEKGSLESDLSSFEILGKEFGDLARQYGKLREEIDNKKWVLEELSKFSA